MKTAEPIYDLIDTIVVRQRKKSDRRGLLTASIQEHLVAARHGEDAPVWRVARKENEHAILREIVNGPLMRDGHVRAWIPRTGNSERTLYRRLAETR